jgi:hypothetical protein
MCSNFGLNLHPGRKPCALQWQWYNFLTQLSAKLRRRFFPKALYMSPGGPRAPRPRAPMDGHGR